MTNVVVDASLAAKWVLREEYSAEAEFLKETWDIQGTRRIVPSWFACEVANVFFQAVRAKRLTLQQADTGVRDTLDAVAVQDFNGTLSSLAMLIAHSSGQRASYDSFYVALAEHLNCDLWTADERFWRSTHASFPFVKWLGNVVIVDDAT